MSRSEKFIEIFVYLSKMNNENQLDDSGKEKSGIKELKSLAGKARTRGWKLKLDTFSLETRHTFSGELVVGITGTNSQRKRWSLGTIAEDTNGPEVVGLEELSSSAAMKMTTATHSRVTWDVDQGWEGGTGLAPSW